MVLKQVELMGKDVVLKMMGKLLAGCYGSGKMISSMSTDFDHRVGLLFVGQVGWLVLGSGLLVINKNHKFRSVTESCEVSNLKMASETSRAAVAIWKSSRLG